MGISPLHLHLHQMADDLVQQPFPLPGRRDRKAPQGVAEAAAGGDQRVILVKQTAAVVQIAVPTNAFCLQKLIHLCLCIGVVCGDGTENHVHGIHPLSNEIIAHPSH